jgi:DHA1 family bicyclomycin/chloramphenicol resistance-like MFS transporter
VIIPDIYDIKTHRKLLGLLNFFSTTSMAVAPVIGSHITLYFGWRANFGFCLLCGVLCFMLGYFFLPAGSKNPDVSINFSVYLKVLRNEKLMCYAVTICFFVIGYWVFIGMASILYVKDLGVKLEHFGFYQGILAAIFAIVSLLSEKLFSCFGVRKCFLGGIASMILSLIFNAFLIISDAKNPLLITAAMALMSAGIICPVNILCPCAYKAASEEKGKLTALIMSMKMMSISFLIQFTSLFYCGSFRIIGCVVSFTMIIALIGSRILLKTDPVLNCEK